MGLDLFGPHGTAIFFFSLLQNLTGKLEYLASVRIFWENVVPWLGCWDKI